MFYWGHCHFLYQEVLFSLLSTTARQGVIWDEMGVWTSLSGLKELRQTFVVWTEVTEGSQLSCFCGHCVPSELVKEDCSWRVLNWTRLLMFYKASGTRSLVFLSQVIPAEAENSTELLLPGWKVSRKKKCLWKREWWLKHYSSEGRTCLSLRVSSPPWFFGCPLAYTWTSCLVSIISLYSGIQTGLANTKRSIGKVQRKKLLPFQNVSGIYCGSVSSNNALFPFLSQTMSSSISGEFLPFDLLSDLMQLSTGRSAVRCRIK